MPPIHLHIQFNEVTEMRGTENGRAFDSDDNRTNTLFQHDFSHNNEGGFILVRLCQGC